MRNRSLRDDASSLQFFAIWACSTGKAEKADERRKCEALQDEGDQDHAKRQADNHVTMGKRRAIGQDRRKRECCGKGDNAAHSGPTNHKLVPGTRYIPMLMLESPPDPVREARPREYPCQSQ